MCFLVQQKTCQHSFGSNLFLLQNKFSKQIKHMFCKIVFFFGCGCFFIISRQVPSHETKLILTSQSARGMMTDSFSQFPRQFFLVCAFWSQTFFVLVCAYFFLVCDNWKIYIVNFPQKYYIFRGNSIFGQLFTVFRPLLTGCQY